MCSRSPNTDNYVLREIVRVEATIYSLSLVNLEGFSRVGKPSELQLVWLPAIMSPR